MFKNRLFSFCCPNSWHLCLKTTNSEVRCSFFLLILQSYSADSFFKVFFRHICSKKTILSVSKHFHGSRLHFQQMKVQFIAVDLISNCFMAYLLIKCKKTAGFYLQIDICRIVKLMWIIRKTYPALILQ